MKSNNILTYLLYLLLAGLIVAAGYKACQIKKDKQLEREKQEAELQKALHDMGYTSADSTASSGSSYSDKTEPAAGGTTAAKTTSPSTASNSGIEDEADKTPAQSTASASKTAAANKAAAYATQTAPAAKSLAAAKTSAATPKSATKGIAASNKNAKFRVQAGSFTKMEGARRRLEEVIKAGYPNAEIGKTNNGKFAVVIVYRTNSKADAINVADKLEVKGIDATVMANE